jgi:peptidoglycan/LPS O-acetylase OafA/YrhL
VLPLTSLRFFLATWIVAFHLCVAYPPICEAVDSGHAFWFNSIFCGYAAVDIFFVLSGFVLALNYSLDDAWGPTDRKRFAIARFSRIYPVYLLALIAVAPVLLIGEPSRMVLLRHGVSGVLNILMIQAWIPGAAMSWNGPGWSLSNEAFFYLCFPILGGILFRLPSIRKVIVGLISLWTLAVFVPLLSLGAGVHGYADLMATDRPDSAFAWFVKYNPFLNIPIFLSGIVACRCFLLLKQSRRLDRKGYILYLPSIALLLALTGLGNRIPYPLMHGGLLLPASVGIVLGLAIGDRYLCTFLSNKVLVFLGKASYAEYLLHFPIRMAFVAFGVRWNPAQVLIYFVAVMGVSGIVFQFYEEPLQRTLRGLLQPSSAHSTLISSVPGATVVNATACIPRSAISAGSSNRSV